MSKDGKSNANTKNGITSDSEKLEDEKKKKSKSTSEKSSSSNIKEESIENTMDDYDADDKLTAAINLVTRHGRSIPLNWKTMEKSKLKNKRNRYENKGLVRLKEFLTEEWKSFWFLVKGILMTTS